ncbi:GPI mannosyltransferase 1-like isoform X2 [Dreissena polymorpha]|uniref:GPI mannosyltransferase 1-like isoform X2 n=1 Tax=Dreissena polymorpha TaxID=45954 RepID=UPI002263EB4C|nr:GPI mannosyltransferase 1-like isoform X2 [Dreissena polymorpha]
MRSFMDFTSQVVMALALRLLLLVYGEWQDRTMAVKFTDIDYHVFSDAAKFVDQGMSPYQRATYRYTPLLAWMLQPNIYISSSFGKIVFILLDVFTGYLIYTVLKMRGVNDKTANICAAIWLLNPLPMTVSSRGNAESVMSCLVLLCLYFIYKGQVMWTAIVYAIAVHFKIYPVIYALPIYLWLGNSEGHLQVSGWKGMLIFGLPNKGRCKFVMTTATVLAALTWICYRLYGWEFIEHTYLYHITRRDIKHNFSPYFYELYLQTAFGDSTMIGIACFIPQVILLLTFSVIFYREPALVFLLNTFSFVTFNKVCTSQYFLWYLCLLPLILPMLTGITRLKAVAMGIWLLPAYLLEFEGMNTFLYIWAAGLAFFLINCYIMHTIMACYRPLTPPTLSKQSTTQSLNWTKWNTRDCDSKTETVQSIDSVKTVTRKTASTDSKSMKIMPKNRQVVDNIDSPGVKTRSRSKPRSVK